MYHHPSVRLYTYTRSASNIYLLTFYLPNCQALSGIKQFHKDIGRFEREARAAGAAIQNAKVPSVRMTDVLLK
jgi:hypothetical protein